jgi:Protein of unknown function (DUF4244)
MTLVPIQPQPSAGQRLMQRMHSSDVGSVTAEYAVATVAACGFAGVLYKLLTSSTVLDLVVTLFTKALSLIF